MSVAGLALRVRKAAFQSVHRLVASRFPPVGLFDRVASREEYALLAELESRSNDRLQTPPRLDLVAAEDWRSGPGWTPVMAAFCHPNPEGSRFSDGQFGVYYAAAEIETAISETVYHRERFLSATAEPACSLDQRSYVGELQQALHDGLKPGLSPEVLDPDDYRPGQGLARELRAGGAYGLSYASVRHPGGRCVALFRPPAIGPVRQAEHYRYEYDGRRVTAVLRVELVRSG
jgi:hypothetical protein